MRNVTTTIRMSATRNEITCVDLDLPKGDDKRVSTVSLAGHPMVERVIVRGTDEVKLYHRWRVPTPAERHQIARTLCDWHGIKAKASRQRHGVSVQPIVNEHLELDTTAEFEAKHPVAVLLTPDACFSMGMSL